jgi:hypothetical protein
MPEVPIWKTTMAGRLDRTSTAKSPVTIEEVNRVLEVGRLLLSVLTPEELDLLQQLLNNQSIDGLFSTPTTSTADTEIGNTGVT